MRVYRISKTGYAQDLSGTGARLFGGRWNHINIPCIYTAGSIALAVLEYSVNVNVAFVPPSLSLAIFEVDERSVYRLEPLPEDWAEVPAPLSSKDRGSALLLQNVPVIEVPSVVVPTESNYLLNPLEHGKGFHLVEVRDFVYDLKIKA